ncbi:MAG TPA: hypothetical protein VJ810_04540 [Blastocatellia bacterium]|nr:hypothetical protein [Blastocatellia bacterium]
MKRFIAGHVLIARLAMLALCALCFPQTQVSAQGLAGYIIIFPSVGVAPDQSVRLTLFNRDGAPLRAQARFHTAGGILVGLADGSVRADAFQSFDLKRGNIQLPGEERTGRIQLSASFHITMSEPGKKIGKLSVSMETISISDGTSNTVFVGEIPPSPASGAGNGNDIIISGFGNDTIMGPVPGQSFRVNLKHITPFGPEAESETRRNPVRARVKFFDGSGNPIAQSDELVIPQGEIRSADLNRDALSLPGEPGTGRLPARGTWTLIVQDASTNNAREGGRIAASFELIDNSTGKTEVLSGHECLVFYLGGRPGN